MASMFSGVLNALLSHAIDLSAHDPELRPVAVGTATVNATNNADVPRTATTAIFLTGSTLSLLGAAFIMISFTLVAKLRSKRLYQMVFWMAFSDFFHALKFFIAPLSGHLFDDRRDVSCILEAALSTQFFGLASVSWYVRVAADWSTVCSFIVSDTADPASLTSVCRCAVQVFLHHTQHVSLVSVSGGVRSDGHVSQVLPHVRAK